MGNERKIQEAVLTLSGQRNLDSVTVLECVVKSVDEKKRTCDAETLQGIIMTGIRLMSEVDDGLLVVPELESVIIVMHTKQILPFICQFSSVNKVLVITGKTTIEIKDGSVKFNNGSFDGFVKINELTTKLNSMVAKINIELGKIQTAISVAGGSYTPVSLENLNKSDYENTKITHGL